MGLPEIFYTDAKAPTHIADKSKAGRAFTRCRKQPGALRVCALLDAEARVIQLREFEIVPDSPVADHVATQVRHLGSIRYATPFELRRVNIITVGPSHNALLAAPSDEWLDGFR